jgi:peptidoglycan/LPS O-acetylase OafA/YrhL
MYDVHLWTIPIEFRNSCVLFATLVGFSRLKARIRMSLTMILWVYCMSHTVTESETALFMAGMGIAEFMLIQEESERYSPLIDASTKSWTKRTDVRCAFWCASGFVGLHLLSWPPWNAHSTPGYRTLARMTPQFTDVAEHFWHRIGAAVFVFALSGSAFLRHPFQTPFAAYLGKISFPLYIVHGPLNHTLGLWLVEMFFKVTGSESFAGYETGVILAFCTEAVVVVWLADLVMRTVDGPSVRFGRWLQSKWEVRG